MTTNEHRIRTIFGLKLRQLREEQSLSLFGLAKKSGLSKSYLNEIEKGKKYPKTDKIIAIATALETEYEELVSTKLTGKMAPVAEMINSGFFEELPLEHFGMEEQQLIDIMIQAPQKVNTFVNTIFQIARDFGVKREYFYLMALRAYQEAHLNYFDELETLAQNTAKKFHLSPNGKIERTHLEELLTEEFGIDIDYKALVGEQKIPRVRSVFIAKPTKRLLIDPDLSRSQILFLLCKELAFQVMKCEERPTTFTWIQFKNFEEVLNNFSASYFAGALLLPKQMMVDDLKQFFKNKTWNDAAFIDLMGKYSDSVETFFQRLTNILPGAFGMHDLLFVRFEHKRGSSTFDLTKELHLNHMHQAHANQQNFHYCRRWKGISILQKPAHKKSKSFEIGAQISNYVDSGNSYFVMSARQADPFQNDTDRSISVGFELTKKASRQLGFANDPSVAKTDVGVTCETCSIKNCEVRAAEPTLLIKQKIDEEISTKLKNLTSPK